MRSGMALATTAIALVGCGSSVATSSTSPAAASAIASSSGSSNSGVAPSNDATAEAMTPQKLASAEGTGATFTQTSDTLFGSNLDSDSRAFTGSDSTVVEIDIAVMPDTSQAASDFKQGISNVGQYITTQTSTSTPSIGMQAYEKVGTSASGKSVVSIAFQQNASLVEITVGSTGAGTISPSTVEAIARTQLVLLAK